MPIFTDQEWQIVQHFPLSAQIREILWKKIPNVSMVYLGVPMLSAMTFGVAWGTKFLATFGWDLGNPFILAVALMATIGTLYLARDVVLGALLGLWHMNWLAKLLTLGVAARVLYWWFGKTCDWTSFPYIDVFAAFIASALSELFYNSWLSGRAERQSHKEGPDEYDEFG